MTTETKTTATEETPEARIERLRAIRAQKRAEAKKAEAKVAELAVGQIVQTDDGYWVLESRSVATVWHETGDGSHYTEHPVVTISKCRKNGARLASKQCQTVNASEFGRWF